MRLIALVDYDNAIFTKERSAADVGFNLSRLTTDIARSARDELGRVEEIRMRLYGGWITEGGKYSQRALWILAALQQFRGRRLGTRMLPSLATSVAFVPDTNLIGTLRESTLPRRQKMVDCMISIDAVHYVRVEDAAVAIVSDDDDLVPATLAVVLASKHRVCLIRKRESGSALNDELLITSGVRILTLVED